LGAAPIGETNFSAGKLKWRGFFNGWIENIEMAEGFGSFQGRNVEMAEGFGSNRSDRGSAGTGIREEASRLDRDLAALCCTKGRLEISKNGRRVRNTSVSLFCGEVHCVVRSELAHRSPISVMSFG